MFFLAYELIMQSVEKDDDKLKLEAIYFTDIDSQELQKLSIRNCRVELCISESIGKVAFTLRKL